MGQVFSYMCDTCDYTLDFYQGVGLLYPIETERILTEIQKGGFGKHFMEAANKASIPSVEYSRELYRCGKCGELRADLRIDLFDGDTVILSKRHVCGKCRSQMNVVESLHRLKCPKCKGKLVFEDMIMWD